MYFSDDFFKAETIDGFYIEEMMKRAWAAEMEVLEEVLRVCRKHDIPVFADYGTLLGTVRHHGFIPWDDDLDLCMKREDFMRFIEIAPQELQSPYMLKCVYNTSDHPNATARVNNEQYINFNKDFLEQFHGCPYAVGIDIFPIDYCLKDKERAALQHKCIQLVMSAAASIPADNTIDEKTTALLDSIEKMSGEQIIRTNPLQHELKLIVDKLSQWGNASNSDAMCHMIPYALAGDYRVSLDCYDESIEMPFFDITIPVPVKYGEILTAEYGANYMTPLIGHNQGHEYPFYRKQREALRDVLQQEFRTTISDEEMISLIDQKIALAYQS